MCTCARVVDVKICVAKFPRHGSIVKQIYQLDSNSLNESSKTSPVGAACDETLCMNLL